MKLVRPPATAADCWRCRPLWVRRFAEVHLVIDHAGQQPASGRVHHLLAVARRQPCRSARCGRSRCAGRRRRCGLVDHPGVGDEGGGHVSVFLCNGKRGVIGFGHRVKPGWNGGSGPAGAQPASCRVAGQCREMASIAYSEQLGTKRQRGPQQADEALVAQQGDEQAITQSSYASWHEGRIVQDGRWSHVADGLRPVPAPSVLARFVPRKAVRVRRTAHWAPWLQD